MKFKRIKLAIMALFLIAQPSKGFSLVCVELLNPSFRDQAYALIHRVQEQRKSIEDGVHSSIGTLSPALETQLNRVFRLYNSQNRLNERQQQRLSRALNQDPIAGRLSSPSKAKLVRLVFRGYARPYMAFLIARYMEEKETRQGLMNLNVAFRIEYIVLSYTVEWTARSLIRNRINDLRDSEKQQILEALRNPAIYRDHRGLNYNDSRYTVGHDSLFIGYLRERQSWIASTNFINLNGSIFE